MVRKSVGLLFVAMSALLAGSLHAQSAAPPGTAAGQAPAPADTGKLEEIVVTAQRREERLQDVPIAITALTGEAMKSQGLTDMDSLSGAVPGLSFTRAGISGTPFIRGVGSSSGDPSSEPSVATYVDGVYYASPNAVIFNFNNVESVDVLKGPQGTLFGRNATGGVIQIQTRDPSFTTSADVNVGYGNYQTTIADGYFTTGLTDTLAVNFAVQYRNQEQGFGRDVTTGEQAYFSDDSSFRGKLLFQPDELTRVLLSGDFSLMRYTDDYRLPNGAVGRDGVVTELSPWDTRGDVDPNVNHVKDSGGSLTIDHKFDYFSVRSISAYRQALGSESGDVDATPIPAFYVSSTPYGETYQENLSQEIHLVSADSSAIRWLLGGYFFDSRAGYNPITLGGEDLGGITIVETGIVKTKSTSAFAQVTDEIFDKTDLTVGLRYTNEKQQYFNETDSSVGILYPLSRADQTFNKPTWRLALDHKFTPDMLGYVSYNRGIKSGGFGPLTTPVDEAAFKPEQLDAYEAGLKTELFDHQLRLNSSVYLYNYKDIQVQVVSGASTFTQNAAAARIKGIDLDFAAVPTSQLTISGGLNYIQGYYTSYPDAGSYPVSIGPLSTVDATGNATIRTPRLTGSVAVAYKTEFLGGTLQPTATSVYTSKFFWAADNIATQPGYNLLNASLRWAAVQDRYSVNLWIKNITDKAYFIRRSPSSYGDIATTGEPRTFGISFGFKY